MPTIDTICYGAHDLRLTRPAREAATDRPGQRRKTLS